MRKEFSVQSVIIHFVEIVWVSGSNSQPHVHNAEEFYKYII